MADSLDLAALAEATDKQNTDLVYVRRGGLDRRMSILTLSGGFAATNHTHDIATTGSSGFMSAAMVAKLNSIDPSGTNYVLPAATTTVLGGVKVGTHLSMNGQQQLFVSSVPAITSDGISDFSPATRDVVGSMFVGTGNVTVTYNPAGTVTINGTTPAHTHTSTQITDFVEGVQDVVGGMVLGAGTVSVGYNDTTGALTITGASGGGGGATTTSGITDYVEATQDLVGAMVQATSPLSATYNDTAGTLNLDFTMPVASDSQLGAIKIDPAQFTVSPTGVLALIASGGGGGTPTTGSALPRLVTVEETQFGGSLGSGKTTAQRIANTAAFNAALAYCRDNKFALFITPGVWEIGASADLSVTQHIVHDNGNNDSAVHVFGHRSVIRQHSTGKSIWDMRGTGGSLSGVTLTYATSQTTGDNATDTGKIKTITVTAGGSGYTTAPTVVITNVGGGSPTQATATAVITSGAVTAVTIVSRGANFTTAPAITFTGGGGSGAAARAEIYSPASALMMNGTTNCSVRNVRTEFAWIALHAPGWLDNAANTIDTFTAANTNGYGVMWNGGSGNSWNNIAITGEKASPPVTMRTGVWLNNHHNSSISKLSVDYHNVWSAISQTGSRGINYSGVNIEGCRPRHFSSTTRIAPLIEMDLHSFAIFNGITVTGTDLNTAGGTASPLKVQIFGYGEGGRADVIGLRVSNTLNKGGTQEINLIGPNNTDAQVNRGVRFSFRAAVLDRASSTPHLIDRLSAHAFDATGEDKQVGLIEFNTALGGMQGDSADWGNVDVTVYPDLHGQVQNFSVPLTAARTVTLSDRIAPIYGASNQYSSPLISRGFRQKINRLLTATGAFDLTVKAPDNSTLAVLSSPGDMVEVIYTGTAYVVTDSAVQLIGTPGSVMGFASSGAAAVVSNTRAIGIPITTEAGVLTTGTAKYTFHQPFAFRITSVLAGLNVASTSGVVTFDINVNGTTILSPKLTIPINVKLSTGGTVTSALIPANAIVDVDCDTAGTGAAGAKVYIVGYPA
jgi:hypothetical protein